MAENRSRAFAFGFLVGAVGGLAFALLKTPRSGKETIDQVRGQGIRLKTRAQEFAGQTRQKATDQIGRVQEDAASQVKSMQQTGEAWVSDVKESAGSQAGDAQDIIEAQFAEVVDTAGDVGEQAQDAAQDALDEIDKQV